jgi:hypothetical protein
VSFHGHGVEVSIMEHDRLRWRLRLSTLMLLVVIAALATYIVVERWQRVHLAEEEHRRLVEEVRRVRQQAQAQVLRASSSAQGGTSPTADK